LTEPSILVKKEHFMRKIILSSLILLITTTAWTQAIPASIVLDWTPDNTSIQGVFFHSLSAFKTWGVGATAVNHGTSLRSAIQITEKPDGTDILIADENNSILCEVRNSGRAGQKIFRVTFNLKESISAWESNTAVSSILYQAIEHFYTHSDGPLARTLEKKPNESYVLKDGARVIIVRNRLDVQTVEPTELFQLEVVPDEVPASLQRAIEKFGHIFREKQINLTWFSNDIARGLVEDILMRTDHVTPTTITHYLRYRLALADLNETIRIDTNSPAFKTLVYEMQKGRVSVIDKLSEMTRILISEGLKEVRK